MCASWANGENARCIGIVTETRGYKMLMQTEGETLQSRFITLSEQKKGDFESKEIERFTKSPSRSKWERVRPPRVDSLISFLLK